MKGADAPEELVENVFIQNKRAASAWSLLHVSATAPGIPTVRAFQAAPGAVRRRWLAEHTGWS